MKHRLACLVIMMALIVLLSIYSGANVFAATNDGSDVHAPSMSVDSGENPIPDMSSTEAPSSNNNNNAGDSGAADDNDSYDAYSDSDDMSEDETQTSVDSTTDNNMYGVTAGVSLIALLGIVMFVIKRR